MLWILGLVFFLTIALSTLTTIPVIVAVILCLTVVSKNPKVFIAAFLGGFLIDIFMVRVLGITSLFLVTFTFMIFLYQRRFEIQTYPFVFLACFIGSVVYLKIFGYSSILIQALTASFLALFLFKLFSRHRNVDQEL